ncbi:MAG: flagellar filament capping protein FliD [Deltaproteobacteria bacterium]|nr:flagellar filament capping protein FliD [Deltaproteobacteria bacterium]
MALISFSGLASGIDSQALIKSLLDQKRATQIKPLETRITDLTETNGAFTELKSLLTDLQSAASKLRSINGGIIGKSAVSSDETVITASAANTADQGTYDLNVISRAKNATLSFDDRYSSSTDAVNSNINNGAAAIDRTLSFTIGTGTGQESVDLVLTDSTTLEDLAAQFNSLSEKATASVVNVGTASSPSYAFVVSSKFEGTEQGAIAVNVGSGITDPNGDLNTADGAFVTNTESAATDAEFTLSGVTGSIYRSSNSITDVISGLTLNLQGTGNASVSVNNDAASTTAAMQEFVDAYNEVVKFISENDLVTREEEGSEITNVFGALAKTSLDENLLSTLRSALSGAGITGQTVNILADLGVTTERDGTLKFDGEVFEDALSNDPDSVLEITQNLGEDLAAVDGKIAQFIRFNGLIDAAANANASEVTNSERRISEIESLLSKEEEALTARFARLESLIAGFQSQQSALTSLLPQ